MSLILLPRISESNDSSYRGMHEYTDAWKITKAMDGLKVKPQNKTNIVCLYFSSLFLSAFLKE